MKKNTRQTKICAACLRPFHNRKKWEARGLWPSIKYCSKRCRSVKGQPLSDTAT